MRYKITPKGRRALTVLVSAAALVVVFVVSGMIWASSRAKTPALVSESPPPTDILEAVTPSPQQPSDTSTPTPAAGTSAPSQSQPAATESAAPIPVTTATHTPAPPIPSASPTQAASTPDTRYLLLFPEGSAEPDSAALSAVDEFLQDAPNLDGLMIMCEGNAYEEESSLAMERARNVRAYLLTKGIPPEQTLAISTEKSPGENEAPELFRRVELYFLKRNTK